jgi:hypothetical protein
MAVAIAKSCSRIGAVLNEKQSFSHVLDNYSDNSTENEVEQEELNTDPTTPILNKCLFTRRSQSQKVALALEPS